MYNCAELQPDRHHREEKWSTVAAVATVRLVLCALPQPQPMSGLKTLCLCRALKRWFPTNDRGGTIVKIAFPFRWKLQPKARARGPQTLWLRCSSSVVLRLLEIMPHTKQSALFSFSENHWCNKQAAHTKTQPRGQWRLRLGRQKTTATTTTKTRRAIARENPNGTCAPRNYFDPYRTTFP